MDPERANRLTKIFVVVAELNSQIHQPLQSILVGRPSLIGQ